MNKVKGTRTTKAEFSARRLWWLPALVVVAAAMAMDATSQWRIVGVEQFGLGGYEDLAQVTASADCIEHDPAWTTGTICDPWGRPYNYPAIWAHSFARAGIGLDQTTAAGRAFVLLYGAGAAGIGWVVLRRSAGWAAASTTLALLSPPVWLALERGSTDVPIWGLMILAAVIAARNRWRWAIALVVAASALKIFPAGAVALALAAPRSIRTRLIALASTSIVLLWLLEAGDLRHAAATTPHQAPISFGISTLILAVNDASGTQLRAGLVGGLVFIASVLLGVLGQRRNPWLRSAVRDVADAIWTSPASRSLGLCGLGSGLFAYALGSSFEYRLIAFIPLIAALSLGWSRPAVMWSSAGLVAALYLSFPFEPWIWNANDILLALAMPFLTLVLIECATRSCEVMNSLELADAS